VAADGWMDGSHVETGVWGCALLLCAHVRTARLTVPSCVLSTGPASHDTTRVM